MMFLSGVPESKIGEQLGITKQRISQILIRYFKLRPGEFPKGLTKGETIETLHVSPERFEACLAKGKIQVIRLGRQYVIPQHSIEQLRRLLAIKYCRMCGKLIKDKGLWYCTTCRQERHRNYYPFLSEERKKKRAIGALKWREKNPEKVRDMLRCAARKMVARKKAEATYTVFRDNPLGIPIGTVVKVTGFTRQTSSLILEDGSSIHISLVHSTYSLKRRHKI